MWFGRNEVAWRGATIVSGMLEFAVGPFALLFLTGIVQRGVGAALGNTFGPNAGASVGGGAITLFSLTVTALHPLTWVGFYILIEGAGRAVAAGVLGESYGTLPLVLLDRALLFGRRKIWKKDPPLVPDQVTNNISNEGWLLKIESCRMPREWDVGRLLLYKDQYYRIESFSKEHGARPYVFLLRSLPAGVRSRSVILYSPESIMQEPIVTPL